MEDCTRTCGNMLGWFVIRGERPIKLRDSWFSTKFILVKLKFNVNQIGRATISDYKKLV